MNTAMKPDFTKEEIEEMRAQAARLNDSLKTLSSEMARIHSQAMTIIRETIQEINEDLPKE